MTGRSLPKSDFEDYHLSNAFRTILITGGSGFLGRQLVTRAQVLGYRVYAPRSCDFDLETGKGMDEVFEQAKTDGASVEAIIHSAAYYGGIGINQDDPAGLITRNTRMTANIFEYAAKHSVKKMVCVGSSCAYPGHLHEMMTESQLFDGRCHPSVEGYGYNKRIQVVFGTAYHKQHGISFSQVALTNMYGEHDVFTEYRSHVISALIKKFADAKLGLTGAPQLWGTGKPKREFVHVMDAADVIVDALHWPHDDEATNLNGHEVSIRELADLIAELVGFEGSAAWDPSKPDGVARKAISGEKLKQTCTFDYQPRSLRDGLKQTIDWYLANKEEADARD